MNTLRNVLGKHTDIALVALVLGVLLVLFAPIPSALLDFLIMANVSFACLILLLTFYMARPVEFSTFPSLLLIATLFRLSLNVAATRLILSEGDAGKVIGAIGSYVVGGNYVIGIIVFLILIVVQYVVVTNGAQRVSEVAARFTLDSMPGQQMSIDADLNMGFIDQAEAQRRRKNLEKEAAFYGAMDGASKFVKGDAIAGIIILLVDSIGGLVIGVIQHGMPWSEALQTYTLLTIGDGIVTQVPALVIAVGTGIIVTRSASDSNLSVEVFRQITSFPKTLVIAGVALAGLVALPGVPLLPAIPLFVALFGAAWLAYRSRAHAAQGENVSMSEETIADSDGEGAGDPYRQLVIEPIEVWVGQRWASVVTEGTLLSDRLAIFRNQFAQELGVVLPKVRFRTQERFGPHQYEIHVDGVPIARGESRLDQLLAIHPSGDTRHLKGEVTKEPTYGLPAIWIDESQRAAAIAAKFTLVDAQTVLMTHLTEVIRREAATLLSRAEVERMLARVREAQPTLVEEIVPTVLPVSDIQRVLQSLLREKVSVRNLVAILEAALEAGRVSKDIQFLTERVRQRLGRAICQGLAGEAGGLHVLTIDAALESQFLHTVRSADVGQPFAVDPGLAELFITRLAYQTERMMKSNLLPVLLCSPELRRHIRVLSERAVPHLRVLSMAEIPQSFELKSFGVVATQPAAA